jgi:hypothetical protein
MQATTQYFGKCFFYKQVLESHRPSKFFMLDIWASKSLVPSAGSLFVIFLKWVAVFGSRAVADQCCGSESGQILELLGRSDPDLTLLTRKSV